MKINIETHEVSAIVCWDLRQFLVGLQYIFSADSAPLTSLRLSNLTDFQSGHIQLQKENYHVNTKYTIHYIQKGTLLIKDLNV